MQASKSGAVAVPIGTSTLSCIGMGLKVKEWSLELSNIEGSAEACDSVMGRHVTMVEAKTLRKLSDPFILPFTDALYMQTTGIGVKVCTLLRFLAICMLNFTSDYRYFPASLNPLERFLCS